MPMLAAEHLGTEADGSVNADYCIYCYKEGVFSHTGTMEELIELCAPFHDQIKHDDGSGYTREEAVALMRELFPQLKRWKKA